MLSSGAMRENTIPILMNIKLDCKSSNTQTMMMKVQVTFAKVHTCIYGALAFSDTFLTWDFIFTGRHLTQKISALVSFLFFFQGKTQHSVTLQTLRFISCVLSFGAQHSIVASNTQLMPTTQPLGLMYVSLLIPLFLIPQMTVFGCVAVILWTFIIAFTMMPTTVISIIHILYQSGSLSCVHLPSYGKFN